MRSLRYTPVFSWYHDNQFVLIWNSSDQSNQLDNHWCEINQFKIVVWSRPIYQIQYGIDLFNSNFWYFDLDSTSRLTELIRWYHGNFIIQTDNKGCPIIPTLSEPFWWFVLNQWDICYSRMFVSVVSPEWFRNKAGKTPETDLKIKAETFSGKRAESFKF